MKRDPVLENVYARVDILDLNRERTLFEKVGSLYLLGEGSKYVKSVKDITIKNKQLVGAIGANAIKEILAESYSIAGGDDWDELDEMDFEDLLNSESTSIIQTAAKPQTANILSGDTFSDQCFYSKDKISDVRNTLAILTNIKPYKQHLWVPSVSKSMTGDDIGLIGHWAGSVRELGGFPIDEHRASQLIQPSLQSFTQSSVIVLSLISVDTIVRDKSKLQFLARSDAETFELIHSNTILRFFSMITLPVFNQYLIDETQIESKYESCAFDKKELIKMYSLRSKLLPELNKQPKVTIGTSSLLTASAIDMTMVASHGDQKHRVDTLKLYQSMDITHMNKIAYVDFYTRDKELRSVRLRKIQQRDQFRLNKDELITFSSYHSRKYLVNAKAISITLLPEPEYDSISFVIDRNCTIWFKFHPNQSFSFSKADFIDFVSPSINPIIEQMNAYDVFTSYERYPKLTDMSKFQIVSSSSRLTFKFPVSFPKLLDLLINKLMSTGFIETIIDESVNRQRQTTSFAIRYGVSDTTTSSKPASINLRDVNGVASIELINLDVDETNLYVDIIGRIITGATRELTVDTKNQTQLGVVDPILFRPRMSFDGYSRICQKRFQPTITTAEDAKAVEYYNFTFQRPEYYKCPSKSIPILGFIQGKHDQGYCLPCCRKTPQPNLDNLRNKCISNESIEEEKNSTYKIEYPIIEVSNSKIMNRRVNVPSYIIQLFGMKNIVVNGTIMTSHSHMRDGSNPDANSYVQTATMISAILAKKLTPTYKSYRELILDIIGMIKQPAMQVNIMKHKIISERFVTPQALIHSIEDHFIKHMLLDDSSHMSAVDWNDLIIFLSNALGLNVLLLSDDRVHTKSIQLMNIHDVDVSKPVLVLLKRINIEWASNNHNTRALYLPVTTSSYKVSHKSQLVIERLDLSATLPKIKRMTSGALTKQLSKQFTFDNVQQFVEGNKHYRIEQEMLDQKIVVMKIGRNRFISSIASISNTIRPQNIDIAPSATLKDVLTFITDYNSHSAEGADIDSYKQYLQAALKASSTYQYLQLELFLLKLHKFIIHNNKVIGMIVHAVDATRMISSEMMFFKPTSIKSITSEVSTLIKDLNALHSRVNAKAILTFPIKAGINIDDMYIAWIIHPLKTISTDPICKKNMKEAFDIGMYTSTIYHHMTNLIIEEWLKERPTALDAFISKELKAMGRPPIAHTRIDTMIDNISNAFKKYDPAVIRMNIVSIFEETNLIEKSSDALIKRFMSSSVLLGFGLKSVHRFTKAELISKICTFMKHLTVKVDHYPSFDSNINVAGQRSLFYQNKKLMIHESVHSDLQQMLVADLMNPFRRDYVINAKLVESTLVDVRPHIGELIYVQRIDKQ